MSAHSMLTNCKSCEVDFYIDVEYETPKTVHAIADITCPECGSNDWLMTDSCER